MSIPIKPKGQVSELIDCYDSPLVEIDASEKFWAEMRKRNEVMRAISERRKDIDWFDSCRPDDRD